MNVTKLLIILLLSISFLNANQYNLRSNDLDPIDYKEINIQKNETEKFNAGVALDITTENSDAITYTIAYDGDYMIANDFLDEDHQIENNNFYIGIGYKF